MRHAALTSCPVGIEEARRKEKIRVRYEYLRSVERTDQTMLKSRMDGQVSLIDREDK
jgi:hypothetical protein